MQRNPAGDLVGPERECIRGDGKPKNIFSSGAEAREWLDERNMRSAPAIPVLEEALACRKQAVSSDRELRVGRWAGILFATRRRERGGARSSCTNKMVAAGSAAIASRSRATGSIQAFMRASERHSIISSLGRKAVRTSCVTFD